MKAWIVRKRFNLIDQFAFGFLALAFAEGRYWVGIVLAMAIFGASGLAELFWGDE